jgi:hypothetical protein
MARAYGSADAVEFERRVFDAELVEQLAVGEAIDRRRIAAGCIADDARQQQRVAAGIGPARAGGDR